MRVKRHIDAVLKRGVVGSHGLRPRTGYVILSGPYYANSAGIICLHKLCHELNRRGYPSFTTGGDTSAPNLEAPMVSAMTASELCARGFTAIYPETISGNPFGANNVVRWVLNRPGLLGGDEVYDDSELVYTYSDVFLPYIKNRLAGKLYMPTIDEELFYCDDPDLSKRNLECYYLGKSMYREGYIDPNKMYEITRDNPRKCELGKLFRSSKVLYCFDNSTILIYEALLCGCPVVLIPDGTQTKEDYAKLELGADGIAWGLEEAQSAKADVAGLRARYDRVKRQFVEQVEQLIADSQAASPIQVNWNAPLSDRISSDWPKRSTNAVLKGVYHVDQFFRTAERTVRRFRKRVVNHVRRRAVHAVNAVSAETWHLDNTVFYCCDTDLRKRSLECFHCGPHRNGPVPFDRTASFEVAVEMPKKQIATVFRASRAFYSYDANSPLVIAARACGCPVVLIDKHGQTTNVKPEARQPAAA